MSRVPVVSQSDAFPRKTQGRWGILPRATGTCRHPPRGPGDRELEGEDLRWDWGSFQAPRLRRGDPRLTHTGEQNAGSSPRRNCNREREESSEASPTETMTFFF